MGFGEQFKKCVSTLHYYPNSLEGCPLSALLFIIRQGCPLSALLFIVAIEMLPVNIKQNQQIRGINIGNENDLEIKIVQLSDDTTLFVDETSVLISNVKTINLNILKVSDTGL